MKYRHCSKCSCYHRAAYDCQKVKKAENFMEEIMRTGVSPEMLGIKDSVGMMEKMLEQKPTESLSVLEREIWNRAIEAAEAELLKMFHSAKNNSDETCFGYALDKIKGLRK